MFYNFGDSASVKKEKRRNSPNYMGQYFVVEFQPHTGSRSLVESDLRISNTILWHSRYKVKKFYS